MLSVFLLRAALFSLPFLAWLAWSAWARRSGRAPGSTPWGWLVGVGCVLVGVSLLASAAFHRDNRGEVYVPGEVGADGRVRPGHYEKPPAP